MWSRYLLVPVPVPYGIAWQCVFTCQTQPWRINKYKMSRVHNLISIIRRLVGIILLRGSCFRFDYAVNRLVD